MGSTGTTTWYAFQDPKTGREYFHEPISGEVSWVLPTSSSASTLRAGNRTSKGDSEGNNEKDIKSQRKLIGGWSAIGVTIVSVFVFNTLFLLILVKVLYANSDVTSEIHDQIKLSNNGRDGIIIDTKAPFNGVGGAMPKAIVVEVDSSSVLLEDEATAPGTRMMSNKSLSDDESMENQVENESDITESSSPTPSSDVYKVDDAAEVENMQQPEDEVVTQEVETPVESQDEIVNQEEDIVYKTANAEVYNKEQEEVQYWNREGSNIIIALGKSIQKALEQSAESLVVCWIPFSYAFIEKCKRQVEEGLPMPLADAENFAWI